jgi:biotin transport system substrate-specific component
MNKAFSARDLALAGIFAAVTAIMAQISTPIPFTTMPISFGMVAVYATGILLSPKNAAMAQLVYLAVGAAGLPVFGGFRGGLGALFGPTGGYLFTYPVMVWIIAMALNSVAALQSEGKNGKAKTIAKGATAICAAHLLLYLGGTLWFSATTANTFAVSLAKAVYPFIPLDIIKIVFCVTVIIPLRSRLMAMNLLKLGGFPAASNAGGSAL